MLIERTFSRFELEKMKYRIYTFIAVVFLLLFGGLFWIIYENSNHGKKLEVATAIPTTTSEKGSKIRLSVLYIDYSQGPK